MIGEVRRPAHDPSACQCSRSADAMFTVRRVSDADLEYLIRRWHETNLASYPYSPEHQRHTLHDASAFFRKRVMVACEVWVAEADASVRGLMAIRAPWIEQLVVFPEHRRSGVGTALLRKAQECSPEQLRLHTFQRNLRAHAFYEHHGFTVVAFGVSSPPENLPDVEYRWAPSAASLGVGATRQNRA